MSEQHSVATTEVPAQHEAEATAFGLTPPMFIALAMLLVIGALIWKKVPHAIGKALDAKIALIRDQLAEAESLRKEAEALKAEYEKKAKSADKDRDALIERAKHEAEERTAIEQLRSAAADAAAKAAAKLIAERHDAASDAKVVDQAIKEIAER